MTVLEPVLFNICIDDLDTGAACTVSKSAEETKLGGAVGCLRGQEPLQWYLDRLEHWAITSGMKYWILHLEKSNTRHETKLGEEWLENSPAERDLGVLAASKEANPILECIKHSITSQSKETIILLYLALAQL
ncbi:hypothetical protein DUI87_18617 [Hirundo rustica rustica]|uniref:Uncharacterized protein n=1 Tax=Hirundo rustica rustica TaxID=333673 RepID=A0A3M0JXB4_HIRRU|nr:hypothetical protein DUI87_18617 [Hirundo rustica rustica]